MTIIGVIMQRAKRPVAASVAALVMLSFAPAAADTTAIYRARNVAFSMTVEIDDNGDVRGGADDQPLYFITRDGEGFLIQTSSSDVLVTRVDDMAAILAEQWSKISPPDGLPNDPRSASLVQKGTVTINGREGEAYYQKRPDGELADAPVVVISSDPNLAAIGKAMARQFAMSSSVMARTIGQTPPIALEMQQILESGAPLLFAGAELDAVTTSPIAANRFELPREPETLDDLRKRLVPARR